MATVLITGGTGMAGTALCEALIQRNYDVIILTRNKNATANAGNNSGLSYAWWDVEKKIIDKNAIARSDYIIHLAGAGIGDKRWTKKRKKEIRDSRVNGSNLISESIRNLPNKIKAVVSASAMGWYGPDLVIPNPWPFRENDPPDSGFLGKTCKEWEEALDPVLKHGVRLVKLRTGIVFSTAGGALRRFMRTLQFGIAPVLGSGKQVMSWIHIDDLVGMYIAALENATMQGIFNAVSPNPVSNKHFILQLAKTRGRFYIPFRVPAFVLKLLFGELSIEVLKSATLSSEKIQKTGFSFEFPTIEKAFQDLLH